MTFFTAKAEALSHRGLNLRTLKVKCEGKTVASLLKLVPK